MALGDGIRRNIASVDPVERALLRDAFVELNKRKYPGLRTDPIPGGVSWWFKQDEIHQATHVHGGPEFLPWHREIVNRLEELLRQINPQLSLHYWDWTQDPRAIPNANLGGGATGTLNLFTTSFMGYGGPTLNVIGEPWLSAGYYVPGATLHRDATGNPADPPSLVRRYVSGSPVTLAQDQAIVIANDYALMRNLLELVHDDMHGFVAMGSQHISFRDPFVFLLHSNVDRLFALWQTQPGHPERLDPTTVYGSESGAFGLNSNVQPWSGGLNTRPWAAPENQGVPKPYKHPSIVTPPPYDTNIGLPVVVTAQGDDMLPGEVLKPNQPLTSANGRYTFVYQGDGNLVLYDGGTPLWASGTDGTPVGTCIMQGDGNLVIYNPTAQPIWSSNTWQHPGSRLVVQDDGNVVIYRPDNTAVWATNTWLPTGPVAQGDDMQPGQVLNPDQLLTSANGRYTFIYQGDGNLVLYDGGTPLWASATDGRPVGVCIMQGDGNLVIYARGGQPIWSSNTWQHPGSRLVLQDDGNVVIYRPDNTAVWATNTWLPTGPSAQGDDMQPGQVLNPDQLLTSANGRYTFIYQGDGNLVLYDGPAPLWASATDGRPVGVCIMQGDGNLVIYTRGGQPIWSSNTWQHPGSRLIVQDDGNVVIYRPDNTAVWATNTWLPIGPSAQGDDMLPGEILNPGEAITSASGRYSFVYQDDGNLVLYDGGTALWASGTNGAPVGDCVMQGDGNLVIYARGGQPIWSTNTWQHPGSRLLDQDDGNVVIYRPDGTPVWATNTP